MFTLIDSLINTGNISIKQYVLDLNEILIQSKAHFQHRDASIIQNKSLI